MIENIVQETVGSSLRRQGESQVESDVHITAKSLLPEITPFPRAGERIPRLLLADDDPGNRKVLALILERLHCHIDFATDGQEALEMWEKGVYDIVLMDIQMPRLNGLGATAAIRKKERDREGSGHTPIIAMTANCLKEDVQDCLAAGMDANISKPIDFNKLFQLIVQFIG